MGVTTGSTPVTFNPSAPVSRGQMTTFINRLQNFLTGEGFDAGEADYFDDDDATTHEANINAVASTGAAQGTDVGKFPPGTPVLRAPMHGFLVRYLPVTESPGNKPEAGRG